MENYFNYFTEIEDHFQKCRGQATLLSPLDWSLIESFRQAGIPVETVLRGMDCAFEKFRNRKSKVRNINSLAYCAQAVLVEHERQRENIVGKAKEANQKEGSGAAERQNVVRLIGEACERLKAAVSRLQGQPSNSPIDVLEHARDSLLAIQREVMTEERLDYECLELRLGSMEEKILAALITAMSDEALLALRVQVSQEIGRHKRGLKAEHVAMLERKIITRRLFDHFGVPRLSLFYLPLN
jgi:hypothetical protein